MTDHKCILSYQKMPWVKCSERLPSHDQSVIFTKVDRIDIIDCSNTYCGNYNYGYNRFIDYYDPSIDYPNILMWCPWEEKKPEYNQPLDSRENIPLGENHMLPGYVRIIDKNELRGKDPYDCRHRIIFWDEDQKCFIDFNHNKINGPIEYVEVWGPKE